MRSLGSAMLADAGTLGGAALAESIPSAGADVPCTHCGLAVPAALVAPGEHRQFCCEGCRAVFAILHEHGLDQYYEFPLRRKMAVGRRARSYDEFDHPAFQNLYVEPADGGLSRVELYLEGVRCASCVWLVERVPLLLSGVARAELNVRRALATIEWDARAVPLSAIARMLDSLGYAPHPFGGVRREAVRRREDRVALAGIGIAGAIAVNVMLPALALYSGWWTGMEPQYERYFRWVSLVLTVPAMFWPGRVFFAGAFAALRARTLHMDLPIAIALGAGFVRGTVNTVTDAGPIYFDGVTMLIFLLLCGRLLQQRGQRLAGDAAELLYSLTPSVAHLLDGAAVRDVPAEALLPDQVVEVRAGETLPADGIVAHGISSLDVSLLTGESRPVSASEGVVAFAGTLNVSAPIHLRVTKAGAERRVAKIVTRIDEGARRRAPVALMADRLSGAFVGTVLVLAAIVYAFWMRHDPSRAVDNAIALLVVTCPCALALATPFAVTAAVGRAARGGIFIKSGAALERLARPGRLFLDKTGTITEAKTSLLAWDGPAWIEPLVLALEQGSTHPIADGFRRAWMGRMQATLEVHDVEHVMGGGISGVVDGHRVLVGSPRFVAARLDGLPNEDHTVTAAGPSTGPPSAVPRPPSTVARPPSPAHRPPSTVSTLALTPAWVAVDGTVLARAGFGDPVRADARDSIAALRRRGWRVSIVSGDDPEVVASVAADVGVPPEECVALASPEDKLANVQAARRSGPVVMAGDGVNDAAAMAAASVGIGVHGGAEACLATSDVYLSTPGLASLVRLTDGAHRTLAIIRRNLVFSLVYNAVGASLAITGTINPLIAAILMPASSVTVLLASWRSRSFDTSP